MNRFFNIAEFCLAELMPDTLKAMGYRGKVALFKLRVADLRFRSDIAGDVIVVPVGYETDLASIPPWAWFLFMAADDPRISAGSVIHDLLYGSVGNVPLNNGQTSCTLTRKQCDQILAFEAMADLGATKLQQWCVYLALRWFGDRWKDGQ